MSCPGCGRENRPGARYCSGCGAGLRRCDACGAELPPDAQFCDTCGTHVEPDAPAAVAQTRKVVTIVFADLAGSTQFQESIDPESVRRMMDHFYAALREAVERHSGVVVKHIGDGVMAAFGVDAIAEDDAWRAVEAAAAMQEAFCGLGWDTKLALRVGVNTGEVIVSEGERDVVGDAVNVAARLESSADAGEVLVGAETWRLTRHLAVFEAVPPLTLRGKSEPVPAYRLLSARAPLLDAAAPFVGRAGELERLDTVFGDAVDNRRARLATVVGSPGLGKSRLASEFAASLAGRGTVLEARFSANAASTFAPVIEALRTAMGDPRLDERLVESPQEAFLAVRRLVETMAAERPVVLVLEDIHWAEPLMFDLVEHLVEWTRDAPVMLLALARPELREVRPALVETGRRAADVIVLEGLDPASSERLACDLLETDALPSSLVARLLAGSEGNPLFVRELVRMLVDDGVLQRDGDGWRSTIDVEAITVPPTIQSLLAARVERLPADERTVLECAAVVGREFYGGAVAELVPPRVRENLPGHLERLRQKEMVEPEGAYWIDEPVLRFHHVLLRDAAYRRLLKEVRAELHERYARWLAAKVGDADNQDDVLGYHLESAHQYRIDLGLFDDRTAALGHQAAIRLTSAGRRALDRDDLPAAAALLGRALARVDGEDPERASLLIDRCEALIATGELADAALVLAELSAMVGGSARLRAWTEAFSSQLAILTEPGRLEETASAVERAARELAKLGDAAGAAKAHSVHAAALARLGRIGECEAALDRALAAAREAGDTRRATAVLAGAPLAALWGPSPVARASGRCLDVVRVLRITTSATTVEATSLRCQAVLEALRGRTDAARRMIAAARRSLEELGHRHGLLSTAMFSGLVELLGEDPAAAEEQLRSAYDGFRALGVDADAGQAAALLARAVLAQGRADEAEALTIESERLGGADLQTAIAWRAVRAEALARRGVIDEAVALGEAAVALATQTDGLLHQADTYLALATVLRLAGRADEAGVAADRATELYDRKGASLPAERASALMGRPPTTGPAPQTRQATRRRLVPNAMTRACERAAHAFNREDGPGASYRMLFADGAVMVDHVHAGDSRPYLFSEGWQSFHLPDDARISVEPLATLGDRHGLARCLVPLAGEFAGPSDLEDLRVMRVDADGRFVLQERFRAEDLHRALARLFELHGEDELEGPARTASARMAESCRLLCSEGWSQIVECYAEDAVVVDHRPVSNLGMLQGRTAIAEALGALDALAGPMDRRMTDVLALSPTAGLLEQVVESRPGGALEFHLLAVVVAGPTGLVSRTEWFLPEQVDEALARFDELAEPQIGPLENTATRNLRAAGGVSAGRFEITPIATRGDRLALVRVLAANEDGSEVELLQVVEYDEHDRKVFSATFDHDDLDRAGRELDTRFASGRAGTVARLHELAATPDQRGEDASHAEADATIATRGERLRLSRARRHNEAGEDAEVLLAVEVDHGGRRVRAREFDLDDFPHAIDAINDRYEALLPAQERAVFGAVRAFSGAVNRRDWHGFASRCSPSFRIVDHRPAGWQARDPGELADLTRALTDMAPDVYLWASEVAVVTPAGMVFIAVNSGTSDEGGQFELRRACTVVVRDGLVDRLEYFGPDDLAAAIARLAELTSGAEARSVSLPDAIPPTTATRSVMRFTADFLTHDWERLSEIFAEDVTVEDRRPGSRSVIAGRAAILENNRQMAAIRERDVSIVATRGDRLVLLRSTWKGQTPDTGPFEVETLDVAEMNEDGLATRYVVFDPSEIDAAYAELDARFEAGEAAPYALAYAAGRRSFELWGQRDWDGLLNVFTPDAVMVDRRPLGWGEVSPDEFVERLRMLAEMVSDASLRGLAVPRLNERASLGLMAGRGRSDDGTEIEIDFYCLIVVDSDRVARLEFLPVEDPHGAIARFDDVTGGWRSVMPANRAQRAGRRAGEFARRHDADLMATVYSESVVLEDRRRGLGTVVHGRDAIAAVTSGLGAVTEIEPQEMATRGESLSLARVIFRGTSSRGAEFEADTLQVTEVDAEGLVTHQITLDGDDVGSAFEELDRRFIAGEGAVAEPALHVLRQIQEVYATRDWDGLSALVHPEFELRDHRPMSGRGVAYAETFVATARSLVDLAPDASVRFVAVPRFREAGAVFIEQIVGTTEEAGPFELPFSTLLLVENGLCTRLEHFPVEELAAAIARFDELTRADPLANAASRLGRKIADRILAHDPEGLGALHEPDAVQEDRRPGFHNVIRGREGHVAQARAMGGVSDATVTVLATRGDRGALFRAVWSGEDGLGGQFEAESLQVADLSPAGLLARSFLFSPDDLDAAFDELDRCFAQGEASTSPRAWQAVQDVVRSHNTQDKDLFLSQARDVVTAVDHRRVGWGELKGRQFERTAKMSVEDSTMRCVAVPRVAPNAIVAVLATTGTVPLGGGTWESDFVVVAEISGDSSWHLGFFAVEDLERALEHFGVITSLGSVVTPNQAQLTTDEGLRRIVAHDYDGLGELFADDAVVDDRRSGIASVLRGRDAIVANYRAISGITETVPYLVATRGERVSLSTIIWRGGSGPDAMFEVELLSVVELQRDERIAALVLFDAAALDDAFAELDRRFLEGEGAPHAAVLDVIRDAMAAHAANDWDRFISRVDPDAVIVDHRPLGWGTLDRIAWTERLRSLVEMAPDSSARVLAIPRLGPRGCVAVLRQAGTTLDGASFELVGSIAMRVENGVATRQDYYGPDQLDEALARYDEFLTGG